MKILQNFRFSRPIYLRTVIFNIFTLANVPVFIRLFVVHYCIKSDNVLIAFFFEQLFVMKKMILSGDAFFYCKYYTTRLSCLYRLLFDSRRIYFFSTMFVSLHTLVANENTIYFTDTAVAVELLSV